MADCAERGARARCAGDRFREITLRNPGSGPGDVSVGFPLSTCPLDVDRVSFDVRLPFRRTKRLSQTPLSDRDIAQRTRGGLLAGRTSRPSCEVDQQHCVRSAITVRDGEGELLLVERADKKL